MTLFEYKIINGSIGMSRSPPRRRAVGGSGGSKVEVLEDMINDLAVEGWEAVNITASNPYQQASYIYCLLRRKKDK